MRSVLSKWLQHANMARVSLSSSARHLRVIDLETTGTSFADGGVVEVGWQDLVLDGEGESAGWRLCGEPGSQLVDPGCAISPATSAIHHIVDEDVAGAPAWQIAAPALLQRASAGLRALAAHRAAFEQRWCLPALCGNRPWICTYKCALRLWPEAPTHSNQGLRYWRRPSGLVRELGLPAHRAGPDAYVTAHHLRDMLALAPLERMLQWSAEPALLVKVPAGSARGRRFRDLGEETLQRILQIEGRGHPDMMFSAQAERRRREGEPPASLPPPQQTLGI